MHLQEICKRLGPLRGCLSHKKTTASHRRYLHDEDLLPIDAFVNDELKITSSKRYRSMADLTQVFTLHQNSLVRKRLTHVMEVDGWAAAASEILGLNTNLVRAGTMGHDMGHGACGHQGEKYLQGAMGLPDFCHEVMAVVIAQKIERKGCGLNLTREALEVMMCHSGAMAKKYEATMSQEARLLSHIDKVAYLFADWNDIRLRHSLKKIPSELEPLVNSFGANQRERSITAICGLVEESAGAGYVSFEKSEMAKEFGKLRKLMYQVYPRVTQQNVEANMSSALEFLQMIDQGDPFLLMALMTDKDLDIIVRAGTERGRPMRDISAFNETAVSEIAEHLDEIHRRHGKIDLCDPDLDW